MKFSVKNLGPIKEGTIAFDKPLTVLVGPNSSGKSYVAYLLYGILRDIGSWMDDYLNYTNFYEYEKKEQGKLRFYILDFFDEYASAIVDYIKKAIEAKIAIYFASNSIITTLQFDELEYLLKNLGDESIWSKCIGLPHVFGEINSIEEDFIDELAKEMLESIIGKVDNSGYSEFFASKKRWEIITNGILFFYFYYRKLLDFTLIPIHFFPAERLALSMLSGSVVENKSKELDQINELFLKEDVDDQVILERLKKRNKQTPKYPLAINDHIYFINGLEHTRKNESPYASFAQEIETMLLKGTVAVDDFGAINFKPQESEQAIGIHVSSSLVKSLAALVLYFKHKAEKGDTLIIDEPEVNLHPDNQRIVARILAKAVHLGFKIVISTHSDYIIRELNNLIALHKIYQEEELKQLVLDNLKDQNYDQVVPLDRENIRVFYFNDNTIQEQEIHEDGFDVSTIDNEIDKLSYASEYIGGVLNAVKKS